MSLDRQADRRETLLYLRQDHRTFLTGRPTDWFPFGYRTRFSIQVRQMKNREQQHSFGTTFVGVVQTANLGIATTFLIEWTGRAIKAVKIARIGFENFLDRRG